MAEIDGYVANRIAREQDIFEAESRRRRVLTILACGGNVSEDLLATVEIEMNPSYQEVIGS